MNAIIYKCRRCHQAPIVKAMTGMDGRPAINIRCRCKSWVYRCEVERAKQLWNKDNQPLQGGRPRLIGGRDND